MDCDRMDLFTHCWLEGVDLFRGVMDSYFDGLDYLFLQPKSKVEIVDSP